MSVSGEREEDNPAKPAKKKKGSTCMKKGKGRDLKTRQIKAPSACKERERVQSNHKVVEERAPDAVHGMQGSQRNTTHTQHNQSIKSSRQCKEATMNMTSQEASKALNIEQGGTHTQKRHGAQIYKKTMGRATCCLLFVRRPPAPEAGFRRRPQAAVPPPPSL